MAPSLSSPVFLASFAVPSSSKSSAASSKGKHVKVASVQPLKGKGKKLSEEVAVGVDGEGIWRYDVSSLQFSLQQRQLEEVWERGRARRKLEKENLLRSTSSLLRALPACIDSLALDRFWLEMLAVYLEQRLVLTNHFSPYPTRSRPPTQPRRIPSLPRPPSRLLLFPSQLPLELGSLSSESRPVKEFQKARLESRSGAGEVKTSRRKFSR